MTIYCICSDPYIRCLYQTVHTLIPYICCGSAQSGDIDEVSRLVTVYRLNAFKGTSLKEDLKTPSSLALTLICIYEKVSSLYLTAAQRSALDR